MFDFVKSFQATLARYDDLPPSHKADFERSVEKSDER